jgi:hypothetical protein
VNYKVCGTVTEQSLLEVTRCEFSINPVTNPDLIYVHSYLVRIPLQAQFLKIMLHYTQAIESSSCKYTLENSEICSTSDETLNQDAKTCCVKYYFVLRP